MISDLIKEIQSELGDYEKEMQQVNSDIKEAQAFLVSIKFIGPVDLKLDDGALMSFDRGKEKIVITHGTVIAKPLEALNFGLRVRFARALPDYLAEVMKAVKEFKKPPVPASKEPSNQRRVQFDPIEPGDDKWNRITTKKTKGMY